MSEPIVFISRNRVKEGMAGAFRQHYEDSIPPIEAGKPSTLVQLAYTNEEATEVLVVRVFPNAEGLDMQLQGADDRSRKTYEFIEPIGIEIYGTPSRSAVEMMNKIAGSGIAVTIYPQFIGGFIRSKQL